VIVRNLLQGTDNWLRWRADGYTSSVAATICGLNPHKTPFQLFAEELGWLRKPNLAANPNVRRGKANEEASRQRVEDKLGIFLTPMCVEWDTDPKHRSSLDGIMPNRRPVELKNPSKKVFEEVLRDRWDSIHVKHHACQVQHQIMVTDADAGLLVFSHDGEDIPFCVPRNQPFIDWMRPKLEHFGKCLKAGHGIQPDPARDVMVAHRGPHSHQWAQAEIKIASIDERIAKLKSELDALDEQRRGVQEELEGTLGRYSKAESELLKLTQYTQRGTIDYQAAWERLSEEKPDALDGFHLEAFRRPSERRAKLSYRPR